MSDPAQTQPGEEALLLPVSRVCKLLSRSRARVYELIRLGELPAIRDECGPRGKILVPREAVHAWIAKKRRQWQPR